MYWKTPHVRLKQKTLSRTTRTALWKACHGRYGRYSWKYCAALKKKKSCGLSGQVHSKSSSTFSTQYKRWDVRNHHKQFFLRTMSSMSALLQNASGAFNKQKKDLWNQSYASALCARHYALHCKLTTTFCAYTPATHTQRRSDNAHSMRIPDLLQGQANVVHAPLSDLNSSTTHQRFEK